MPRVASPFPITAKLGNNAYKVELPNEYNISNTFNIGDLQLHQANQELRSILPQEEGVEPCTPYSDHGSGPSDIQFDPTQSQRHSLAHIKHPTKQHEENKNRTNKAQVPSQEKQDKPTHHSNSLQNNKAANGQHYDDQATLHPCLKPNHTRLEMSQSRNDLFAHGPSHQGPRTLLMILTDL